MTTPAAPTAPTAAAPAAPAAPAATPATPPATTPAPATTPPAVPTSAPSALETAGSTAPTETKPAEPKVVELKAPKGLEPHFEALAKQAKELGLEGEKAQKFLDTVATVDAARAKQLDEALTAQDAKWAAELKADPEIGGPKFDGAMKDAARALARFGGTPGEGQKVAPLAVLLHQAGLGNHPLVLRAFAAIGRSLKEDSIAGTTAAPPKGDRPSDAAVFFPTDPA
jgi:hypothetical protein